MRDPRNLELYLGIHQLSDRQVDILDRNGIRVPEPSPRTLTVNMSLGFANARSDGSPQFWKLVVVGPQGALCIWR